MVESSPIVKSLDILLSCKSLIFLTCELCNLSPWISIKLFSPVLSDDLNLIELPPIFTSFKNLVSLLTSK